MVYSIHEAAYQVFVYIYTFQKLQFFNNASVCSLGYSQHITKEFILLLHLLPKYDYNTSYMGI